MDRPLLNDEREYPGDEVLARHLGKAKAAWDAFTTRLASDHPDASLEWRFYKDGKSWLCKLVRKKKTVCWISIWDQLFKTTFYFTAKSDEEISGLPIARTLKDAYRAHPPVGKLKPLAVEVTKTAQLQDVFALIQHRSGPATQSGARSRVR